MSYEDNGNLNFRDLYNDSGKLMPPDWYDCIVTETQSVRSSTGKPMIKVKMIVETGPKKGSVLFDQHVLSVENPAALRMWFQRMKIFGLDGDYWADNPPMQDVADRIRGRRVRAEVVHREWPQGSGIYRENVNNIQASQVTGPLPPNLAVGGSGGGAGVTPPRPSQPATPTPPTPPAPSAAAPTADAPPPPPQMAF